MTWDVMSTNAKKLKNLVTDKGKYVGFTIFGDVYDGDGNIQWESGTDMEITFKNNETFKKFMNDICKLRKVI